MKKREKPSCLDRKKASFRWRSDGMQKKSEREFEAIPGYHSHTVIYTVLGAGIGVSASSFLSLCFNAFSSVSIWLSCLSAVTTVL